jgi:hypothetical protein
MIESGPTEGNVKQSAGGARSGLNCFLFIYLVRDREHPGSRYCTVLAYGRNLEAAERIAINRVHQQSLRIVRADTATAAPWLDPASDGTYLTELASYGSALHLSEPNPAGLSASAA